MRGTSTRFESHFLSLALGLIAAIIFVAPYPTSLKAQAPTNAAEGPATDAPTPELVARLIRHLGDADYLLRTDADRQLSKLGSAARKELEQAAVDPNPEVRLRAKELLQKLKIEALWEPAQFRYAAKGTPASEAVAALTEQTGNHVLLGDQYGAFEDRPIDVAFEPGDCWPTIDEVCRLTGNRLRPLYDSKGEKIKA